MALWIIATPIGTLGDLSPRASTQLTEVDLLCAEDTRVTLKLLRSVGGTAPKMRALHAHNEVQVAEEIAEYAETHEVGLVSDAGTPSVSDPGRALVEACHRRGVRILSVPGPSALATALAASGFPAAPSSFIGFAPRKGRKTWAEQAAKRPETVVFYEAPTRVAGMLRELALTAPTREVCLCRELSKRFEENLRGSLEDVSAALSEREKVKGECVVVLGPLSVKRPKGAAAGSELAEGASLKEISAVLAARWGLKKREAYQHLLKLEQSLDPED